MSNSIKLRLVYYMWIPSDGMKDDFFDVHFKCLERYANVFDESRFYLAIDDVNDTDKIREIEEKLISIGFVKNVSFTIVKNNPQLREAKVFKTEIADKLAELDGLTFFAHSKGTFSHKRFDEKSNLMWVSAMYFFNLEYINEMIWWMTETCSNSYGFFRLYDTTWMSHITNTWMYAGTFMWLNCQKIDHYITSNKVKMPELYDKGYAEDFVGNTTKWSFSSSKGGWIVTLADFYDKCEEYLPMYFGDDKGPYNDFLEFFKTIYNEEENK